MRRIDGSRRPLSLRTRLLAGVLAPGAVLLVVASTIGAIGVVDAVQRQTAASALGARAEQSLPFYPLINAERNASLRFRAAPSAQNRRRLDDARAGVDASGRELQSSIDSIAGGLPDPVRAQVSKFGETLAKLAAARGPIDAGSMGPLDINATFTPFVDNLYVGAYDLSNRATAADVANRLGRAADVMRIGELVGRAGALASGGLQSGGLAPDVYREVVRAEDGYRAAMDNMTPLFPQPTMDEVVALRGTDDWKHLQSAIDVLIAAGASGPGAGSTRAVDPPTVDPTQLAEQSQQVSDQLLQMGLRDIRTAWDIDIANAAAASRSALTMAIGTFLGLLIAVLIALTVATRMIGRLARLRQQTLALADSALPDVVRRLQRGEAVDTDVDLPALEHGKDEIGEVARAFNHAQRTAVRAAVDEAHTRSGFNTAFLNIARRSQSILHQQMEILDRIERAESDPDQLELLFRLDHLATRERRNAENLVILGGEQPRRQWRNPVPLTEVVRGAVGEAEHYQRVTVHPVPDAMIVGPVVGDVVHLLAELVDNATAFSPPEAPIEVRGRVAGRGVVVEIEDQGLGIEDDRLAELNRTLREPPDFSLFTLSTDSRVGLFVVAWLARKHGMTVSLRASTYGGVLAGVLIPSAVLAPTEGAAPAMLSPGVPTALPAGPGRPEPAATSHSRRDDIGITTDADAFRRRRPRPADIPIQPLGAAGLAGNPARTPEAPEPGATRGAGPGLPQLPQRRRQAHMDPRLHGNEPGPAAAPTVDQEWQNYSPDTARSRLSALQRGSAQARRAWQDPDHPANGEH